MQKFEALEAEFVESANQIAETLLDGFGVKHDRAVDRLHSPLLRWLDFRLRFIDPRPRKIYVSDQFPMKLHDEAERALHLIENKIITGEDVNPYQGKGLTLFHDTSAENRSSRTDLLWADWGIHHLHLSDRPVGEGSYFSGRAGFLLFAVFGRDHTLFIDIQPHKGDKFLFSREELIKIIARNWPSYIDQFRLKGVLTPKNSYTDEQRAQLRKAGIDPMLTIDGNAYFSPGGGVTTAATSGMVTSALFRMRKNLRSLANLVLDPDGQFLGSLTDTARAQSQFSLSLLPDGIAVIELNTKKGWTFPEAKGDATDNIFTQLSDDLTPPWVKHAMTEAHQVGLTKPTD